MKSRLASLYAPEDRAAVAPVATAGLLALCQFSQFEGAVCWFALAPLAWTLRTDAIDRRAYAAAFVAGLAIHLSGLVWMIDSYRGDALFGPYAIDWFRISCYCGMVFTAMFAVGRWIARRSSAPLAVILPLIWVAFEFAKATIGQWYTGIPFPWLRLGFHVAAGDLLAQAADLGGEYGLSALCAAFNGALADLVFVLGGKNCRPRRRWLVAAACGAATLPSSALYGLWRLQPAETAPGPVACLMGEVDLPPLVTADRIESPRTAAQPNAPGRPDLLVWPELAYHRAIEQPPVGRLQRVSFLLTSAKSERPALPSAIESLQISARELGATLVMGCERRVAHGCQRLRFNSLACVNADGSLQGFYDKINLVPGVEATEQAGDAPYQHGESTRIFTVQCDGGEYHFGTAICYDVCFGEHFRSHWQSRRNVDFFVQLGAEAHDRGDQLRASLLRAARLRAIENRRAVVRNVTAGVSGVIDGNGRLVRGPSGRWVDPIVVGPIPLDERVSCYRQVGDRPAALCLALTCALAVAGNGRKTSG